MKKLNKFCFFILCLFFVFSASLIYACSGDKPVKTGSDYGNHSSAGNDNKGGNDTSDSGNGGGSDSQDSNGNETQDPNGNKTDDNNNSEVVVPKIYITFDLNDTNATPIEKLLVEYNKPFNLPEAVSSKKCFENWLYGNEVFDDNDVYPYETGITLTANWSSTTFHNGTIKYTASGEILGFAKENNTETTLEIPSDIDGVNIVSIGENAFKNNTNLTKVTLPTSITNIKNDAFNGCLALTEINLQDCSALTNIGNNTFENCEELTKIELPNSVEIIGDYAFSGCLKLTEFIIPKGNTMTKIGDSAFENCHLISGINIQRSVNQIGKAAFKNCSALLGIEISNNIIVIETETFFGCSSLDSIKLSIRLTKIDVDAFKGCTSLLNESATIEFISNWQDINFTTGNEILIEAYNIINA